MGLVVGEGSFTGDRRQYRLSINLHESDIQPLLTVKRLLWEEYWPLRACWS